MKEKIYVVEDCDHDGSFIVGYHTDKSKATICCDYLDSLAEENDRFNGQYYKVTEVENLEDIDYLNGII